MKTLTLTAIAASAALFTASSMAHCPMHKDGTTKGYDNSTAGYTGQFVRTGGYGMAAPARPDIVDTAVEAGSFGTLATALEAAGLIDTLKGDGPFTVFAPTDEAFAKLPESTVEDLLRPENRDQLTAIVTYHVVPGSVMAKQVVGLSEAATVNGQSVGISFDGATVQVDNANVVATDIMASNGVIHIIDSVILPE